MTTSPEQDVEIELRARIAVLHSQLRSLKLFSYLGIGVLTAWALHAPLIQWADQAGLGNFPDSHQTRELVIRDRYQNKRVIIGTHNDETYLQMFNREGQPRLILGVNEDGGIASMIGREGRTCLSMGAAADGSSVVMISDRDGRVCCQVGTGADGATVMLRGNGESNSRIFYDRIETRAVPGAAPVVIPLAGLPPPPAVSPKTAGGGLPPGG